ncbi:hypothetical protein HDU88_004031 [Geranomyces variabilis]|nr:hypothetical protein HDU88_004031 [Geranomyces variabilis]
MEEEAKKVFTEVAQSRAKGEAPAASVTLVRKRKVSVSEPAGPSSIAAQFPEGQAAFDMTTANVFFGDVKGLIAELKNWNYPTVSQAIFTFQDPWWKGLLNQLARNVFADECVRHDDCQCALWRRPRPHHGAQELELCLAAMTANKTLPRFKG